MDRLNSNIYKNIFPEVVINMDYINNIIDNTPTTTEDIVQENHGFELYDVVYLDSNGKYQKALAEDSTRANVQGMVSKISSPNVFTLMDTGKVEYTITNFGNTSILYLSDKFPGKLMHYSDISNNIYIPVAICTDKYIIINIQTGSIGDILSPYSEHDEPFELYTEQELDDTVNLFINGVTNNEK